MCLSLLNNKKKRNNKRAKRDKSKGKNKTLLGLLRRADTHSFDEDPHELWKLVCEHGQHGTERAKARCEEDEERKLLLWVH